MKAEHLSGRGTQVFLMRAQEVLQAETGNRPRMTAVVPEERLQERQDSAAQQTQHGLVDKMAKDSQQNRPKPAAQQAEQAPEHAGVQQKNDQREPQLAARQAEYAPEEDGVVHSERKTMPAAQQAQHDTRDGLVGTQQPMGQSCTAKGPDAAKLPEEVAHPQNVDGQTFFDAREGVVPSSPTAPWLHVNAPQKSGGNSCSGPDSTQRPTAHAGLGAALRLIFVTTARHMVSNSPRPSDDRLSCAQCPLRHRTGGLNTKPG